MALRYVKWLATREVVFNGHHYVQQRKQKVTCSVLGKLAKQRTAKPRVSRALQGGIEESVLDLR